MKTLKAVTLKPLAGCILVFAAATQSAHGVGLMITPPSRMTALANAGQTVYDQTGILAMTNPAAMSQHTEGFAEGHLTMAYGDFSFNEDWDCRTHNDCGGDSINGLTEIPTLGFILPLTDRTAFGLTMGAVSGQGLDYKDHWRGRTLITENEVQVVSLANALSYKINEQWSVGATFEVLYGFFTQDVTMPSIASTGSGNLGDLATGVSDYQDNNCGNGGPVVPCTAIRGRIALAAGGVVANVDSIMTDFENGGGTEIELEGDDLTTGTKFGLLYTHNDHHRLGLTYHQMGDFTFEGEADVSGPLLLIGNSDPDLKMSWDLPDKLVLSGAHTLLDNWVFYWDFERVFYSEFEDNELRIDGIPRLTLDRNFKDANRYALGAEYQLSKKTTLQFGASYDESPVDDEDRNVDIPLDTFIKVFAGAIYQLSDTMSLSGYVGYEKLGDAEIEREASINGREIGHDLSGDFDQQVFVFGGSLTRTF